MEAGEDKEFIDRNFGANRTVVLSTSSEWFPGPCTAIAFYHTRNKSSRESFFGRFAADSHANTVASNIPPDHMDYVRNIMEKAGLATTVNTSSDIDSVAEAKAESVGV